MGKTEAIFSLKPVTFHYKNDNTNTPRFGLVTEEVAKVNPALIAVDKGGKPNTVRYNQINAMLLNEFLKEHRKVEQQAREIQEQKRTVSQLKTAIARQQAIIAQQQKGMEVLSAQLKQQTAQIQKVSARLDVNEPAPQVVVNKR